MKRYLYIAILLSALAGLGLLSSPKKEPVVEMFGDVDTGSTNNKDTQLDETNPTSNFGSTDALNIRKTGGAQRLRSILHFTLPSGTGTITRVALKLTKQTDLTATGTVNAHELTQTSWSESQATWNVYSTGNSWAAAGGDYSATVIDAASDPGSVGGVLSLDLMGGTSDNPLTLDWQDDVHILLKQQTETGGTDTGGIYYSKENGTAGNRPYLEITYSVGGNRRIMIIE